MPTNPESAPHSTDAVNAAIRELVAAQHGAWSADGLAELARLQAAWLDSIRQTRPRVRRFDRAA